MTIRPMLPLSDQSTPLKTFKVRRPPLRFGVAHFRRVFAFSAFALVTVAAFPALASQDSLNDAVPWPINDADPSASVPSLEEANKNPLGYGYFLMALTDVAVAAEEKEDWEKARRYYRAIYKGAKDRAVGLQKVCAMDKKLKEYPAALEDCFNVLALDGVEARDFLSYAQLVIESPEALAMAYKDKALNALDHFHKQHPVPAMRARCLIGTRFGDQALMELCVPAVLKGDGEKPTAQSLSFAWQLEVMREDWKAAQARVDQLKSIDADPDTVRAMQQLIDDKLDERSAGSWRLLRRGLLVLSALGLFVWWRRKKD